MNEVNTNLWTFPADLRCITTNGVLNSRGAAVMGRGCALEAKLKYPGLAEEFGALLRKHGNRVMRLRREPALASFPTKRHWKDRSCKELIERSSHQLVELVDKFGYRNVVLPRPGCGNGGLIWNEVRDILLDYLDDRFTVVYE